jgi:hypothetical protein
MFDYSDEIVRESVSFNDVDLESNFFGIWKIAEMSPEEKQKFFGIDIFADKNNPLFGIRKKWRVDTSYFVGKERVGFGRLDIIMEDRSVKLDCFYPNENGLIKRGFGTLAYIRTFSELYRLGLIDLDFGVLESKTTSSKMRKFYQRFGFKEGQRVEQQLDTLIAYANGKGFDFPSLGQIKPRKRINLIER